MDQVRAVLKVLWVQRFWVLSVLCVVVGTLCWNMAAGELDQEFSSRKSKIESAFTSVGNISREDPHPNNDVINGDTKQAKQQRNYVLKVWQELYERQRASVIKWPESISKEFVKYMEGRKFGDRISSEMRGFYLDYVETRFDALLEIVEAKKTAERGSLGRGGGFGGEFDGEYDGGQPTSAESIEQDYLVLWLDQAKLQQKLLFKSKPSTMQVWVTQEDLWVYETLLNVIAKTNKERGATRPDNTAIRAIVKLEVGSGAAGKSMGRVHIPQSDGGGMGEGGYGESDGGYGEYSRGGEEGGEGFFGTEGGTDESALVANRYLDSEGKPDPRTSGPFGSTEFRQLPVHMTLMMDQRWIPRVLIECANASLPVEVKQVRVNPSQSGVGVLGKSGATRQSRALTDMPPDANLAEVQIRGVVYIYKEPAAQELAIPGDDNTADDNTAGLANDSI